MPALAEVLDRRVAGGRIGPAAVALLVVPAAAGVLLVQSPYIGRVLTGVVLLAAFLVVALNSRSLALRGVFIWLTFLGFIRRALIPLIGFPRFDPLLLVAPACAIILWLTVRKRADRSTLSVMGMVLFGFVLAHLVNPHVSLYGNLLGSLFWFVPLLWFFVGRTLDDEELEGIFRMVPWLLIPVLALGFMHSVGRFLPFELTWVGLSGGLGGAIFLANFQIRSFSTLTSPAEYAFFLVLGLVVLFARLLYDRDAPRLRYAGMLLSIYPALFLQASRGSVVAMVQMTLFAMVSRVRAAGRLITFGIVGFLLLLGVTSFEPREIEGPPPGASTVEVIVNHQLQGLLNPGESSAPVHIQEIVDGLRLAWNEPLGIGPARGTLGQVKAGLAGEITTETDIGNAFVAFGLPGGLFFLAFIGVAMITAMRRFSRERTALSAMVMLLAAGYLGQWWNGGLYATSSFLWISLGWLARPREKHASTP